MSKSGGKPCGRWLFPLRYEFFFGVFTIMLFRSNTTYTRGGVSEGVLCHRCGGIETMNHALFTCYPSKCAWKAARIWSQIKGLLVGDDIRTMLGYMIENLDLPCLQLFGLP
ncbi:hypothetical protein Adt_36941 [Abeliophyllum distichum]|uniref:Reverse transcriptase zinc-binding domain-containing protein n=1 Tax=Abeliophyllum distichum TaxID=126358 RepID=A0ABD1QJ13_9LAMI